MHYAEVILPLPLNNTYTYNIPPDIAETIQEGCRVIVQFGKKKYYTGIVAELHSREQTVEHNIKDIFALLSETPVIHKIQLDLWRWISNYYLCKMGDIYKAALPPGFKIESDSPVSITESMKKAYKEKKIRFVKLTDTFIENTDATEQFITENKRATQQIKLLQRHIDLCKELKHESNIGVEKEILSKEKEFSTSALAALIKKGILETYEKSVGNTEKTYEFSKKNLRDLSEKQIGSFRKINESFKEKQVCLLHGITSSGKTEIYIHLISQALTAGKQVLYMLPEIAITTQITQRLAAIFGKNLYVYHSKCSDSDRAEIWNTVLNADAPLLVLGVRSSVFLPFSKLGLVIIDEEHETSYKQQDPSPRYHARSAAIVLATMSNAKVLLGSATPSIESYFNAMIGKYGLVELNSRFGNHPLPKTEIIDITEQKRKKLMKHKLFSPQLVKHIEQAINKGEQTILFQNRRGFASLIECKACGWVPQCKYCDVSLTFHKRSARLSCHYCGYTIPTLTVCECCEGESFQTMGYGTEQVEEEIALLFPQAKTARLDLDTARTRTAYERIIQDFEEKRTNILIGTQMISKGLDFANVSVVGILNADSLMAFPDFRSHERAFQLMTQVSGRAGRREKQGTVIIQTRQPQHPIIKMASLAEYKTMLQLQLDERKLFSYPPFFRMITIVMRSRDYTVLQHTSAKFAHQLRQQIAEKIIGPSSPAVSRTHALHIKQITIKTEAHQNVATIRTAIQNSIEKMKEDSLFKQIHIHFDVDPQT